MTKHENLPEHEHKHFYSFHCTKHEDSVERNANGVTF